MSDMGLKVINISDTEKVLLGMIILTEVIPYVNESFTFHPLEFSRDKDFKFPTRQFSRSLGVLSA